MRILWTILVFILAALLGPLALVPGVQGTALGLAGPLADPSALAVKHRRTILSRRKGVQSRRRRPISAGSKSLKDRKDRSRFQKGLRAFMEKMVVAVQPAGKEFSGTVSAVLAEKLVDSIANDSTLDTTLVPDDEAQPAEDEPEQEDAEDELAGVEEMAES